MSPLPKGTNTSRRIRHNADAEQEDARIGFRMQRARSARAIEAVQNTDTLVYCIPYTQKEHGQLTARNRYGIRVMRYMSHLTGAADFDALSTDLETVFAQIGNELRAMYQIGYVSSNDRAHDGSYRKVTVRCREPGTTVRAKSGYYAR